MAKMERKRPETREFSLAELEAQRPARVGYYAEIFEELKRLAGEGKGLVVEFKSESAGTAALKRLAAMGVEDGGWSVYQQKTRTGRACASRYVWVTKEESNGE